MMMETLCSGLVLIQEKRKKIFLFFGIKKSLDEQS